MAASICVNDAILDSLNSAKYFCLDSSNGTKFFVLDSLNGAKYLFAGYIKWRQAFYKCRYSGFSKWRQVFCKNVTILDSSKGRQMLLSLFWMSYSGSSHWHRLQHLVKNLQGPVEVDLNPARGLFDRFPVVVRPPAFYKRHPKDARSPEVIDPDTGGRAH